jgi:hypothetical protein
MEEGRKGGREEGRKGGREEILEKTLTLGHDCFLPYLFKLIIP